MMVDIGFTTTGRNGFHITFENGWTVSVQFGPGNYCANRDWPGSGFEARYGEQAPKSHNAEIAAWDANGKWFKFDLDEVAGWQSPANVLAAMNKIAAMPPTTKATGGDQ